MTGIPHKRNGTLAYELIAKGLRDDIITGKHAPGSRLPSTRALAKTWKTSCFTIHTAVTKLVKQGWIERVHGHGTYVARKGRKFHRVGIYHVNNIWADPQAIFGRQLNQCLVNRLHAAHKTTHIYVESRPDASRDDLLPELADAIFNRRIDCLIGASIDLPARALFKRLSLPTVAMGRDVNFDHRLFVKESVRHLALQGCRSAGLLTNLTPVDDYFLKELKAAGLTTRREWILHPSRYRNPLVEFGYQAFRSLHKMSKKPDGLIVYPDLAAQGVILGVLQCSTRIPRDMKLVFHSNAHVRFVCPFPVTWAISDENEAADALIASIEKQFSSEPTRRVTVPFSFKSDSGQKWLG